MNSVYRTVLSTAFLFVFIAMTLSPASSIQAQVEPAASPQAALPATDNEETSAKTENATSMSKVKILLDKAKEALLQGDEKKANQYLSEVVTIARRAWDMEDITTAEAIFRQVLILKPDNAEALFGIAELYRRTNPIMAVEYYTRYIQNHPSDPAAYYGRGSCYLAREAYSLAIQDLETLINRLEPNNIGGLTNLALAYRGRAIEKNYDPDLFKKAVDTMTTAVTTAEASNKPEAKKLLPELKYRLGRLIFENQQIIARAQTGKANFSDAINYLKQSIQESFDASSHDLNNNQAVSQMILGYDALSEIFQAQSQLNPKDPSPYMNLAQIVAQRSMAIVRQSNLVALSYLKKAVEVDPSVAKNWAILSDAYARLGNVSEAIQALDKAIKIEPANEDLQNLRKKLVASTHPTTQPNQTQPAQAQ